MAGCNPSIQVRFNNCSSNNEKLCVHQKTDSDNEGKISFCLSNSDEIELASEANDNVLPAQLTSETDDGSGAHADAVVSEVRPFSASVNKQQSASKTIPVKGHSSAQAKMTLNKENDERKETNAIAMVLKWCIEMKELVIGIFRRTWNGYRKISSMRIRLLVASLPIFVFTLLPNFFCGLFVGIYLSFALFFHYCVSPIPQCTPKPYFDEKVLEESYLRSEDEDNAGRVYKGWMNILNERYHPHRFHVNTIQTVLVRLDGNLLRISRPDRSLLKHAFHNDPTLTEPETRMLSQNIYDLTNATVKLRPRRLARRRWFSRKYPICIRLSSYSKSTESHSPPMFTSHKLKASRRHHTISRSTKASRIVSKSSNAMEEDVVANRHAHFDVGSASTDRVGSASLNSYSTASTASENFSISAGEKNSDTTLNSDDTIIIARDDDGHQHVSMAREVDTHSSENDDDETDDDAVSTSSSDSSTADDNLLAKDTGSQMGRSVSEFIVVASSKRSCPKTFYAPKKTSRRLFIFARSSREKERWFHRFRKATSRYLAESSGFVNDSNSVFDKIVSNPNESQAIKRKRFTSLPTIEDAIHDESATRNYLLYILTDMQFSKHIEDILPGAAARQLAEVESGGGIMPMDLGRIRWHEPEAGPLNSGFIDVVNLIASRIFYDFCRDEYWIKAVQEKIQTKLATIHLPHFVETLELSNFNIGTAIPRILDVYPAIIDEWGIWIDFKVKYDGRICLMIETKVNLMKLKYHDAAHCNADDSLLADNRDGLSTAGAPTAAFAMPPVSIMQREPSRYSDDEIPESPETSPDEEFGSKLRLEKLSGRQTKKKSGQKLLNLVDKIAQSKYFKEATELKPIRKVMEEISSTRLILNVEITALEGIMTANLPTPPSDRLWYGFRKPPHMSVRAVPQVGGRSVAISALSDWIETKIQLLLEKNLVIPNLDDVVIPVQSGNILLKDGLNM